MTNHPQDLRPLPRVDPDCTETEPPLATASWLSRATVLRAIKEGAKDKLRSPVILGQLWEGGRNHLFMTDDDRHLVTIAGSRAGKGRGMIIPNLLSYPRVSRLHRSERRERRRDRALSPRRTQAKRRDPRSLRCAEE